MKTKYTTEKTVENSRLRLDDVVVHGKKYILMVSNDPHIQSGFLTFEFFSRLKVKYLKMRLPISPLKSARMEFLFLGISIVPIMTMMMKTCFKLI
jgi:hypothetical protein